jgi:hypothetical protein
MVGASIAHGPAAAPWKCRIVAEYFCSHTVFTGELRAFGVALELLIASADGAS